MTVRRLVLPLGAVVVLVFGVYLFLAVRAEPEPPKPLSRSELPRPARRAEPMVAQAAPALSEPLAELPPSSSERPPPVPLTRSGDAPPEPAAGSGAEAEPSPLKLNKIMQEANRAYDRGDYDQAKSIAGKLLEKYPDNVRMMRIMVSVACLEGDHATAQANFPKLPPDDQEQMRTRCARYGIAFP